MGILNVTPDSFSNGGLYFKKEDAIKRAIKLYEEGADIIDIGGESARPGSDPVDEKEEINRVIPVIKEIKKEIDIPISLDTYKSSVAERGLDLGVEMINDISGLRFDKNMAKLISKYNASVVIMHIKGRPKDMQINPVYRDLISEIKEYLRVGIDIALSSGIKENKIVIDPGIGFGKTIKHNPIILNRLYEFKDLRKPILIGTSRKSFIGYILKKDVSERFYGTAATVCISILKGANIVRVHDVFKIKDFVKMTDAIRLEREM